MPKLSAQQLYKLYAADKLVVHTMPASLIDKRPAHLADNTCLMCGSIMFFGGLVHKDNKHIPNAVARFGDDSQDTLFATLHSLDAIFDTHEALEQQKPQDKRGEPFVLFANSDIGNKLAAEDCQPPKDYMEAVWRQCPPVQCERGRGFDFRAFCETKEEKEDPSMEDEGVEWNEMRAVLNHDNMVGLMYIHDPTFDPQQHVDIAKKLSAKFNNGYELLVFKLRQEGHHQGDLLVVDQVEGAGCAAAAAEGHHKLAENVAGTKEAVEQQKHGGQVDVKPRDQAEQACRLVTFWEYL